MDSIEGHTKLPWHTEGPDEFGDHGILHSGDVLAVAAVVSNLRHPAEVAANAALIVRAVNSHKALVEALTKDVERLVRIREKLLSWSDMTGTQRAYFANWVWHAENETRDALRLAGEDQS